MKNLKVPDNFHADFPARMADGRVMTDFTSNCVIILYVKKKYA